MHAFITHKQQNILIKLIKMLLPLCGQQNIHLSTTDMETWIHIFSFSVSNFVYNNFWYYINVANIWFFSAVLVCFFLFFISFLIFRPFRFVGFFPSLFFLQALVINVCAWVNKFTEKKRRIMSQ